MQPRVPEKVTVNETQSILHSSMPDLYALSIPNTLQAIQIDTFGVVDYKFAPSPISYLHCSSCSKSCYLTHPHGTFRDPMGSEPKPQRNVTKAP